MRQGVYVILLRGLEIFVELTGLDKLLYRPVRQVWIYAVGTVTEQESEIRHFPRLAAFEDNTGLGARRLAYEVVVHRCAYQKRGKRGVFFIDSPVAQYNETVPGLYGG